MIIRISSSSIYLHLYSFQKLIGIFWCQFWCWCLYSSHFHNSFFLVHYVISVIYVSFIHSASYREPIIFHRFIQFNRIFHFTYLLFCHALLGGDPWLDNLYVRNFHPRNYPPGFNIWPNSNHAVVDPWICPGTKRVQ